MVADFGDLRPRLLSALAMIAVGALALWVGGYVFGALAVLVSGLMGWELYRMTVPDAPTGRAEAHGVSAAILVAVFSYTWGGVVSATGLVLGAILLAARLPRDRWIFGAYMALILLAGHGLIALRDLPGLGLSAVLFLLVIVIASDVGGYFGGRLIGGPKFWPRVSPKKTWSGTVVGWVLAVVAAWLLLALLRRFGLPGPDGMSPGLALAVVFLAFAGQMGDIAESAIKRHYGVKDSSNLIPGHGGVMDRFDALIAVAALAWLSVLLGGWRVLTAGI